MTFALPLLCLCLSCPAWSWSGKGHIAVTQSAIRQLSDAEQDFFASLVAPLLKDVGNIASYGGHAAVHPLAVVSVLPDRERRTSLQALFNRYQASLPARLRSMRESNTSDWHYANFPHADDLQRCDHRATVSLGGKLYDVLPILWEAVAQPAVDDRSRALMLSFAIHMLADAYQPLHNITRVNSRCRHDRGGNDTCIVWEKSKSRCDWSLHRLWDSGAGYVDVLWQQQSAPLSPKAAPAGVPTPVTYNDAHWLGAAQRHADTIYGFVQGKPLGKKYVTRVQEMSKLQLDKASAHISHELRRVYLLLHPELLHPEHSY